MKKVLSLIVAGLMLALPLLIFSSCGKSSEGGDGTGSGTSGKNGTIAVIQFGSHASLNNCYDGIIKGLEENGIDLDSYKVEHVNSNFDAAASQSQANSFVNSRADVIIAIATPSAVAAANAAAGDIPVVYCAVTDSSVMTQFENVTGSTDIPNFSSQLKVVTKLMGKRDLKIGVLSSTEESSSPIQVESLKKAAEKYDGMEILDSVVSDINTIDARVNSLIDAGAECFINLLDNTIVGKLETNILPITNEKKIPVFGSEIEQVKVGCAASASIEYIDVGRAAGKAAAGILNGKKASEIPVAVITDPTVCYNSSVCNTLGLLVPPDFEGDDVSK